MAGALGRRALSECPARAAQVRHTCAMDTALLVGNALSVLALMTALWVWSVVRRDASVVDPWWSMGFLLITARSIWVTGATPGKVALGGAVALWALRLWAHLTLRARGKPEDPRYQAFRARYGAERYWWVSYFQVFLLQGVLMFLIAAPLQVACSAAAPDALRWNDLAGLCLFAAGFFFEALGDWQLTRFRNDPAMRGRVLDTGLWRYTRHPNYFGESLMAWGFWLCAYDQRLGLATVFAPVLMTFLLLNVSGVTLLEQQLVKSRPGYADYVRRTSAFWPRRPSQRET